MVSKILKYLEDLVEKKEGYKEINLVAPCTFIV